MNATFAEPVHDPYSRECGGGQDVVEVGLLLHTRQVEKLQQAASDRGQTMGQLLRHLIRAWLADVPREE